MAKGKKDFKSIGEKAAANLISQPIQEAEEQKNTNDLNKTNGLNESNDLNDLNKMAATPKKKTGRPKREGDYVRVGYVIPTACSEFLDLAAWKSRKTVTQYLIDLIQMEMNKENE